jgi:5-methylcytosine-specific restriction protein A
MSPIEKARSYIRSKVQDPALQHPNLPEDIKRKVKNSNIWLSQFERVGDLIAYLKRFELGSNDPTYQAMHAHGLVTFEDIADAFERDFSLWVNDCTRPTDFIVGEQYSAYQILIFARNYDTRAGGMFVLESGGQPSAVVIKATLSGGRYANAWLAEPHRLKYFLKSIGNEFGEHFKANAAILNNKNVPILTFVRSTESGPFTYQGIYKYHNIHRESDDSKWFELERNNAESGVIEDAVFASQSFVDQTNASRQSSHEQRLERLAAAPKKPSSVLVLSTNYKRNPDVVVEVLARANGRCEECGQAAPFIRKSDGTPYLEVHHRVPLAENGEDTVENAVGLCPNCHREAHFGWACPNFCVNGVLVTAEGYAPQTG